MRLGAWLDAGMASTEMLRICRELEEGAERDGTLPVDSVWLSEAYIGRDSVALAAAVAQATTRLRVATAVVNPLTRHPGLLAMTALTMNELAPGRFILGIGLGEPQWMEALGYETAKPLGVMRQSARQIRDVLAGRPIESRGHAVRLIIRNPDATVRLYLAAVGPRMCGLAGREFDGCVLPISTPTLADTGVREVRAGIRDAGRPDGACETVATLLFAAGDDPAALRGHLRRKLGLMLMGPAALPLLERNGVDPDHAERFHRAIGAHGLRRALDGLPDDLVDQFCVHGSLDRCAERLTHYGRMGLDVAALLCEPPQVPNLLALARRLGR